MRIINKSCTFKESTSKAKRKKKKIMKFGKKKGIPEVNISSASILMANFSFSMIKHNWIARTPMLATSRNTKPRV